MLVTHRKAALSAGLWACNFHQGRASARASLNATYLKLQARSSASDCFSKDNPSDYQSLPQAGTCARRSRLCHKGCLCWLMLSLLAVVLSSWAPGLRSTVEILHHLDTRDGFCMLHHHEVWYFTAGFLILLASLPIFKTIHSVLGSLC